MAKRVRVEVRRQAVGDGHALDDAAHAARGDPASAEIDQQRAGGLVTSDHDFRPRGQVGVQGVARGFAERDIAFFLTFAANQDGILGVANVFDVDSRELGVANAAAVEEFEQKQIALGKGGGLWSFGVEYAVDFFQGRNPWKLFGKLGGCHQSCRILFDNAFARQPAVERTHRCQRSGDGGLAEATFIEKRKKAANADVVDLLPGAGADETGKYVEILGVGLDRMNGRILFAQVAEKLVHGLFHDGSARGLCGSPDVFPRGGGECAHVAFRAFARG